MRLSRVGAVTGGVMCTPLGDGGESGNDDGVPVETGLPVSSGIPAAGTDGRNVRDSAEAGVRVGTWAGPAVAGDELGVLEAVPLGAGVIGSGRLFSVSST